MACTLDFIEYVCGQIPESYAVRYRKMFGEYMVYINEKPLFLVCDNTVFIKKLPCVDALLRDAPSGLPYPGAAREHHVLDIDDRELVARVIACLEPVVPVPKPKKKR